MGGGNDNAALFARISHCSQSIRLNKMGKRKNKVSISKSRASIFDNPEELERIQEREKELRLKKRKEKDVNQTHTPIDGDDDNIMESAFPFNYIYLTLDVIQQNMNLLRFVQLMCIGYIAELMYFNHKKLTQIDEESWMMIGFNILGVVVSVALAFYKGDKTVKSLPEFNQIYLIFIPTLFSILHFEHDWAVKVLSLNHLASNKLHPFFSGLSALVFHQSFSKSDEDVLKFIQFITFFYFCNWAFRNAGLTSLLTAETHLISVMLTILTFHRKLVHQYLPLNIFRVLVASFFISTLIVSQIYTWVPHVVSILTWSLTFYGTVIYQLDWILGENAIKWLYGFIFEEKNNLQIFVFWSGFLAIVVPTVFLIQSYLTVNARRKVWHVCLVVILMGSPLILTTNVEFTLVALLGTIFIFALTELIRSHNVSPLGPWLRKVLAPFQDEKDQGDLSLSYVYLIVGATIPIVYDYMQYGEDASIIRYLGVIALGLGDSMALIVGRRFGTWKWKGSNKSVQGTVAFILTVLLTCIGLNYYMQQFHEVRYVKVSNWENVLVAAIIAGVIEGVCDINDNFLIPLILPGIVSLLNMTYTEASFTTMKNLCGL